MPRPVSLTADVADRLVYGVEKGLSEAAACRVAGVPLRSFRRWMAEGRNGDDDMAPLAVFARRVVAARAFAAVDVINRAAKTDWRAAAWQLEQMFPDEYGPIGGLSDLERRVDALSVGRG
jgi:hypothetical protein